MTGAGSCRYPAMTARCWNRCTVALLSALRVWPIARHNGSRNNSGRTPQSASWPMMPRSARRPIRRRICALSKTRTISTSGRPSPASRVILDGPADAATKKCIEQTVRVSHQGLVKALQKIPTRQDWKEHWFLRRCIPLQMEDGAFSLDGYTLCYCEKLGLTISKGGK